MILLLIGFSMPLVSAAIEDSIGIETVDGKTYILHRIEQGETLYRISLTYSVAVQDIYTANPALAGSVYKAGQVIRVPSKLPPPATAKATPDPKPRKPDPPKASNETHQVQAGETLFSISQRYGLTVKQLMSQNDMESTDIREGQVLIVALPKKSEPIEPVHSVVPRPTDTAGTLSASSDATWTPVTVSDPSSHSFTDQYQQQLYSGDYIELQANGAVTWVPELTPQAAGFYALHKTIPVGSMIKVTNPINKRMVYAKVVGNLPGNTSEDNVILKLPSTAKTQLKIFDEVMYVEISYMMPRE
jgi:LysM repeat protein